MEYARQFPPPSSPLATTPFQCLYPRLSRDSDLQQRGLAHFRAPTVTYPSSSPRVCVVYRAHMRDITHV